MIHPLPWVGLRKILTRILSQLARSTRAVKMVFSGGHNAWN